MNTLRFFRTHRWWQAQCDAFSDGELRPAHALRFESHLGACAECQRAVAGALALKAAFKSLPEREAPRSFRLTPAMVAVSRLSPAPTPHHPGPTMRVMQFGAGLAAAALAVVVVVDLVPADDDGGSLSTAAPMAELASSAPPPGATAAAAAPVSNDTAAQSPLRLPTPNLGGAPAQSAKSASPATGAQPQPQPPMTGAQVTPTDQSNAYAEPVRDAFSTANAAARNEPRATLSQHANNDGFPAIRGLEMGLGALVVLALAAMVGMHLRGRSRS
jgi:hypothetical protein